MNNNYEIKDVMRLFRIKSRNTVYRWIRDKKINPIRVRPRKQVFTANELRRFVRENRLDVEVGAE